MSNFKKRIQITCQRCGQVFEVIPSQAHRKFCSTACASPEKKVTVNCERCGKAFETWYSKASGARFCSRECRKSRIKVACDVCGKIFETITSVAERGRRFCSRECRNNAQIKVTCETCGKVFGVSPTRAERVRYCSKACMPPAKKVTLTCEVCKKSFEVWPVRVGKAKFCSTDCARKHSGYHYYGTSCKANDGHTVHSNYEKIVDDWLYEHGLEHETEPRCPWDKSTNPRRADFKVNDFYIEVWGLVGVDHYEERRMQKLANYKRYGVKLIEILPAHITHGDFSPLEILLD